MPQTQVRQKPLPITWKSSNKPGSPRILGINPWIYDFAAYNVWSRPAGLLTCLEMLWRAGCHTALMDLMDKELSDEPWPAVKPSGNGHYPKVGLPKPFLLRQVPRQYSRYGIAIQRAEQALLDLHPKPDLILITSLMTYWYPGIISAIEMVRRILPAAHICLGGIYASLCFEHALKLGADSVISGPMERPDNWARIWGILGKPPPHLPENAGMIQDTSHYQRPDFSIIITSRGCPFKCSYCASPRLYPCFCQARPQWVIAHIKAEYGRGVRDFCFYDDALLVNPEKVLYPVLEFIIGSGYSLRLHAPNALHVKYLTPESCTLLKKAGLVTVRLGLETINFTDRRDSKLTDMEWRQGISNLLQAGFSTNELAIYVLAGMPGQKDRDIELTMRACLSMGIRPELNHYSPIPGTPLFSRALEESDYPLQEPLWHNNSLWPCVKGGFSWEKQKHWKELKLKLAGHGRRKSFAPGR